MAGEVYTNTPTSYHRVNGDFVIACPLLDPEEDALAESRRVDIEWLSHSVEERPHKTIERIWISFEGDMDSAQEELAHRRATCANCLAKALCHRKTTLATNDTVNTQIYLSGHTTALGQNGGLIRPSEKARFRYKRIPGEDWQPNPEYVAPAQPVQIKQSLFSLLGNAIAQWWKNE